ncbi:hypothetical protein SRABI128_03741 [Microbacterium sp. Bi128]|nr:hypothetical protein SRABI128_03741 [Microbacterium sp. Bi128]
MPSPEACSWRSSGFAERATDGAGSRASIRAGADTLIPDWAERATNRPEYSAASISSPGPMNCSRPARWIASISRSLRGGGPESTKLKKPCHQPWTSRCDRAFSRSDGTSRPRSM